MTPRSSSAACSKSIAVKTRACFLTAKKHHATVCARSKWPFTLDQDAMHDTRLAQRIVVHHAVHGGAVVPHDHIPHAPNVAVVMPGLARFVGQFVEQGIALRPR